MNQRIRQRLVPNAPFNPMQLLHWMMVLILVMDLASSPWHAHHHEGGPDSNVAHAAQIVDRHDFMHGHGDETALHLDADHSAHVVHSVLALRTSPIQLAGAQLQDNPQDLECPFWLSGGSVPPTVEANVRWRPGKEREPIPLFRTLPPDGHAPPTLHA